MNNNKYQEALDRVRAEVSFDYNDFGEIKTSSIVDNELNLIQELVNYHKEKETPMKVCGDEDGEEFYCPNSKCHNYFCICEVNNRIKYCPDCGQRLDWSDEQ